jgi:hypothetical protein
MTFLLQMEQFVVEPARGLVPTQANILLNSAVNILAQSISSALPVVISSQASDLDGKIPYLFHLASPLSHSPTFIDHA